MGSEKLNQRSQNSANDMRHETKRKAKKYKVDSSTLASYWALAVVRILLTVIPQTGYIHPDEYFQTVEIVAGDAFDLEVSRPWEFNVTFPIRSILLPKLLFGIPYTFLRTLSPDLSILLGWDIRTPYVMLILPRLVACSLSFITDYCLYKICLLYGQKYRTRLLILGTSYVPIIFGTRTLTNSLEMALMSLLLYIVADCMVMSEKVIYQEGFIDRMYISASSPVERTKLFKMRAALPSHSLRRCFPIATIVVAGIFNRPTFFAFGLAPVFFWLQRGIKSKYCGIRAFHLRILFFTLNSLPALFFFIVADSFYYGHLTWNEVGMGDISLQHFVVTPFNFLLYNSRTSNLAVHGLHPRVTHVLLNIPLLYNVLGLSGMIALCNFLLRASQARWRELPRAQSVMMLMTASMLIPIIALSMIPHQEARFLIPITLPLVFLHAQEIQDVDSIPPVMNKKQESIQEKQKSVKSKRTSSEGSRKDYKSLINLWIVINCLFAVFFGFIHQGGIYPLTAHVKELMRRQTKTHVIHLVTSYLYPIPQSLLLLRNSQHRYYDPVTKSRYLVTRKFYAYELGSASPQEVSDVIRRIIYEAEVNRTMDSLDYSIYLALPSSLVENHSEFLLSNMTLIRKKVFYPHVTTEALPHFENIPFSISSTGLAHLFNQETEPRKFTSIGSQQSTTDSLVQQLFYFFRQFSLSLYHVRI